MRIEHVDDIEVNVLRSTIKYGDVFLHDGHYFMKCAGNFVVRLDDGMLIPTAQYKDPYVKPVKCVLKVAG